MAHENVGGKIRRLYVHTNACNIWLDQEGERYFQLLTTHANYHSIYALFLAAASNRWKVQLRLSEYQPPEKPPDTILYIVVDYPQ
jgi:hypothetical protein